MAAAKLFRQMAIEDGELYHELLEPMLERAVWDAVREAARHWRAQAWNGDAPLTIVPLPSEQTEAGSVTGLEAMAETQARSILDTFMLHSGVMLGDATPDNLREAIEFHHKQAAGNAAKARFLRLVLAAMEDAGCVRDALTDTDVRTLRDRAKRAA